MTHAVDDLVISGWSAVSPFGIGAKPFAEGMASGRGALSPVDGGPRPEAGVIPDLDLPALVGGKGIRSMDRVTGITLTAVRMLLDEHDITERDDTGVVLGTGTGSAQSIMTFTRDTLTGDKPYHVDPARFPNTVMNRAAGQTAIRHRLRGPNTTIAGGAVTGLLALNYATRLRRAGRCAVVLCGAAEELSPERSWLSWHGGAGAGPLGEGGVMFLLESATHADRHGRRPIATILGTRFAAFHKRDDAAAALRRCVRAVLGEAGGNIRIVAGLPGHRAAIADLLPPAVTGVDVTPRLGDTSAAAACFQLAGVLSATGTEGGAPALVVAVDPDGQCGCLLLRTASPERTAP
jgi:3-oxoacyl-[acyl-carrier-protein] synthase II